jgi:hypothetical protein
MIDAGAGTVPAGEWSIYNHSNRPNYQGGPTVFGEMSSSTAPNGSLFVDASDGKLKFKDRDGTVNSLY